MVFANPRALVVCSLFMLLVMAMIVIEQVFEFADFMTDVYSFDMRIPQLSVLELLLYILEFLAGLVVKRVKKLLQPLLFPRIRHVSGAHNLGTIV